MFETTVIRAQAQASEHRAVLLTASVAVHTLAVAAVVIGGLHSLRIPTNAPNQMVKWSPYPVVELQVQKGTSNGSAEVKKPAAAAVTPKTPVAPSADATPEVIPSQVNIASASTTPSTPGPSGPGNDQPIGDPNGVDGGLPIARAVAPPVVTDKIYHVSEVNPPVAISRVSPDYPRVAQSVRKSGWVVVECVIDSSGHTRDAHVTGSSWEVFEKPALDAVQQWVFKPGTLNGQPVNTLFQLRVTFTLH
jgi:TonB family protein